MPLGLGFGITQGGILSRKLSAKMVGEGTTTAPLAPITRNIIAAQTGTGTITPTLTVTKNFAIDVTGTGTIAASILALDPDYQAYLDRGTTLGYSLPSASQQAIQNQLVLDLKSAGAWSLLDGFFIWAQDGDSDMATINLVNPSNYQLTKVNSITFTTNLGFKGNGSNMYLNTNFNPVTEVGNYSSNDACIGGWVYQAYSSGDRIAGHITSGNTRLLNRNLSAHRINSGSTSADLTGTGLIYANKVSSGNVTLVKNTTTTAVSTSDLSMPSEVLTFFLSQGSLYGDMGMSFGFYGASLTGVVTDFYNALNDYLNSI